MVHIRKYSFWFTCHVHVVVPFDILYFRRRDDNNMCLRHGFNHYERTQVFHWCRRYDCPDAARLRLIQADNPFGNVDLQAPTCIVNKFMFRLVSCVLSHIFNMRRIMDQEEDDYGLETLSCERFLGIGWQATYLKRFCQKVEHVNADADGRDLIALGSDHENLLKSTDPLYRQAHATDTVLLEENRELDLTQVLPVEIEFHLSDVSHTM